MKNLRFWQAAGFASLAVYATVGLLALLTPRQEIFPFYSWFLFAMVPHKVEKFGLRLVSVEGRQLTPPKFYEEADGYVHAPHAVSVQKVIQSLGAAIKAKNAKETLRLRRFLEETQMPREATYEIVRRRYDPMKRWKTGEESVTPIATFKVGATKASTP